MAKLNLKLCMGTMCYVMGGAELRGLIEQLPDQIREHISVTLAPCLDACTRMGEPPYIELNGRIVAGVSKKNLIQILKEELNNVV